MKSITRLTLLEQAVNFVGDIILVRFAGLGIAGAGLATSISQIMRACITFVIVARATDVMKTKNRRWRIQGSGSDILACVSKTPGAHFNLLRKALKANGFGRFI